MYYSGKVVWGEPGCGGGGAGFPRRVAPAVAFDYDPVEPQERPAVDRAGIEALAHLLQGPLGDERAKPGQRIAGEGAAKLVAEEAGQALGGLQRHIAGEAIGADHVHLVLGDGVARDEARIL